MKETLLAIVKEILSVADSDDVNTISDSEESLQAANIVKEVWRDMVVDGQPEHESLIKLTALSDTDFPTHFQLADGIKEVKCIWYDISDDGSYDYRQLTFKTPEEFLSIVDARSSDYTSVDDKTAGTKLRIINDQHPNYYTSFDDEFIVMDSHKSTVDTTLQESKIRALGTTYPTFTLSDTYTPDIDANLFPQLIQESKSRFFSVYKGQPDPKLEQSARRNRVRAQNDRRRVNHRKKVNDFCRR